MTESAFHDKVLDALSDLKVAQTATTTEVKNIVDRLDITNGRIAAQERKTGDMQIELAERRNNCPLAAHVEEGLATHILQCPLKERMDAAEEFITNAKAKAREDGKWMSRIWPVIYAAGGVLFYLILANADAILKAISLKHHVG